MPGRRLMLTRQRGSSLNFISTSTSVPPATTFAPSPYRLRRESASLTDLGSKYFIPRPPAFQFAHKGCGGIDISSRPGFPLPRIWARAGPASSGLHPQHETPGAKERYSLARRLSELGAHGRGESPSHGSETDRLEVASRSGQADTARKARVQPGAEGDNGIARQGIGDFPHP